MRCMFSNARAYSCAVIGSPFTIAATFTLLPPRTMTPTPHETKTMMIIQKIALMNVERACLRMKPSMFATLSDVGCDFNADRRAMAVPGGGAGGRCGGHPPGGMRPRGDPSGPRGGPGHRDGAMGAARPAGSCA